MNLIFKSLSIQTGHGICYRFKTIEETAEYVEEIVQHPVEPNKKAIQKALDDYAQLRMDCNDEEIRYSFHELKIVMGQGTGT